ncbi:hypothetical protein [Streptomyces sp. NPDC001743]|uniref:hypothetical protein n=1 Tax=Streptomyces sp. NPDC001743 TaxID=3154397 RepID=UPI00332B1FD6
MNATGRPAAATQAVARTRVGAKVAARKGVLSAVRPDPQPVPVRWLHVVAQPSFSATPSAQSWCRCGYERTARGRAGVLALIEAHTHHPEHCPQSSDAEGSKVA